MECALDGLLDAFRRTATSLPDPRRGSDKRYALTDAAACALWVFFFQAPSFLQFQRRMQQVTSCSNCHTLFGVEATPCDNLIRDLPDGVSPDRCPGGHVRALLTQPSSQPASGSVRRLATQVCLVRLATAALPVRCGQAARLRCPATPITPQGPSYMQLRTLPRLTSPELEAPS